MLSSQLRKILLLCPGSNNVEANEENYQKQWTAGPMDSNFFAVIFVSVLRMTKYSPVLHRKSKPKTYLNINEGQATSFPGTLRTWCELQIICIVFTNTDTQYFDMSLVLGIRPTFFDHLSVHHAANLQQALRSNDG